MDERTIFITALDKQDPQVRAAYLDAACGDDADLRSRIEGLLKSHNDAGSFLESPPVQLQSTVSGGSSSDEAAPDPDPLNLDFLDPCDKPDRIGMLGPYEIIEVIGRGGMGIVFRAHDPKLNRVVAVKVMAPEFAASAMAVKRFRREAQAAAAVSHDHVVTIHAVDEANRLPYLVLEYVNGRSLQEKIDLTGALELKEILRIGMQTAEGLAAAHRQGLVHRDIKPSNILLENAVERVKITDFGLARAMDDIGVTQTGQIAGTPQYMSPEQAQGQPVDARTDLFSLGSVLYTMCTGRGAFRADTTVAILRRVCDDIPRPIRDINSDVPDWLIDIINRLMAKDPDDRFRTAQEVSDLLAGYLAHLQHPSIAPRPAPIEPANKGVPTADDRSERILPVRDLFRHRLSVAAAVLLLLFAGLGVTEATGVTRFAATVIRIVTGHGILIVEVDDPSVRVTIDGEDVVINGAGAQEVRVKPGRYNVVASKDGRPVKSELVTISRGGRKVVSVSLEPGQQTIKGVKSGRGNVVVVAYSPDGKTLVTAGRDTVIKLWDVKSLKFRARMPEHRASVVCGEFSPDGSLLATGSWDDTVCVWNVANGELLQALMGHWDGIRQLAFLPDGKRLITASEDKTVKLWNVETGAELKTLMERKMPVVSMAVSPDGKILATSTGIVRPRTNGAVKLWDIETGQEIRTIVPLLSGLAFSRDGRILACRNMYAYIALHDVATGVVRRHLRDTRAPAFVTFSPDGRIVASSYIDGTVKLHEVATGTLIARFQCGDRERIWAVAFSPDGNTLAGGGSNGIVTLWDIQQNGKQVAELRHTQD